MEFDIKLANMHLKISENSINWINTRIYWVIEYINILLWHDICTCEMSVYMFGNLEWFLEWFTLHHFDVIIKFSDYNYYEFLII